MGGIGFIDLNEGITTETDRRRTRLSQLQIGFIDLNEGITTLPRSQYLYYLLIGFIDLNEGITTVLV